MAITLKVTPEDLQAAAGDFQSKNSDIVTYTSNITETINGLTGAIWSGDAQAQYVGKINAMQADITSMCSKLDKSATNLIDIAGKYTSAETTNTSTASALSSSIIS